jgi:hypothetical protein
MFKVVIGQMMKTLDDSKLKSIKNNPTGVLISQKSIFNELKD